MDAHLYYNKDIRNKTQKLNNIFSAYQNLSQDPSCLVDQELLMVPANVKVLDLDHQQV